MLSLLLLGLSLPVGAEDGVRSESTGAPPTADSAPRQYESAGGSLVTLGETIVLGVLDEPLIEAELRRHMDELQDCYRRGLAEDPSLNGRMLVKFVVSSGGTVRATAVESSSLENPLVEGCINGLFARLRFPSPEDRGSTTVSYPLTLSTGPERPSEGGGAP